MLRIVLSVGKVWHSTDSVLYLERLVQEKDTRIEELKEEIERLRPAPVDYFSKGINAAPSPIQGRESWSVLKARITREQREKARDAERATESSD